MIVLTGCDLKHIVLIQERINMFESNKLDLCDIIYDLSGLLKTLESVSDSWKNKFQAKVNALEIIYDSIEDESISQWDGDYKKDIINNITELKKMTSCIIEEYLSNPDLNIIESAIEGDDNWFICPNCSNAWKSDSTKAMVICPECRQAFHNPRKAKTVY